MGNDDEVEAFVVEHDSPLTAWGQIRRDLRRRVDDGEFAAGSRIPTEAALMDHYGVSRVTIRRTIAAMVEDGYLRSRRGSGTYVTLRALAGRYDLDLYRPWREQLAAQGHDASSHVDPGADVLLPPELERSFGGAMSSAPLVFVREVHVVDDIPIGLTESWTTRAAETASRDAAMPDDRAVVADCFAEIGFATTVQAELLQSYLDIPLIVVHARSVLADTGHLVEISRTSWLASRVRLAYTRHLHLGEIDSLQLLSGIGEQGRSVSGAGATPPPQLG